MSLGQPNIPKKTSSFLKQCSCCGQMRSSDDFAPTKAFIYKDGKAPWCDDCMEDYLRADDYKWETIDAACRFIDLPFIPAEWERIKETNSKPFHKYADIFQSAEFDGLGWNDYDKEFRRLKNESNIEGQLPAISEEHEEKLRKKWGANYDLEALYYLEGLFQSLQETQTINGGLQLDQAKKLCKISYSIDSCIRAGDNFDKLLSSYEKLVKVAEFTPKNAKNLNDFDSVGELMKWLEKRGWHNPYYDDVKRDVVDETIQNIQSFNRRLYSNESTIGEEITRRLEALKSQDMKDDDNYFDTEKEYDLDNFEAKGYESLITTDEFAAEVDK